MHEMLHAAGFMHEQNRPDRDKFVTVNYNNIQSGKNLIIGFIGSKTLVGIVPLYIYIYIFSGRENNFEKAQSSMIDSQGIGYDYRSVMHYSANAFSRNGQPTIDPKVICVKYTWNVDNRYLKSIYVHKNNTQKKKD